MTFIVWLEAWIEASKDRRDMWGPFAHWMGNCFHRIGSPPHIDDFGVIAAVLRLEMGDVKRFMLAELFMTYERHVSPNEWGGKFSVDHPCDHWLYDRCFCKGACSCHWKQTIVSEDGPKIKITDLDGKGGGK